MDKERILDIFTQIDDNISEETELCIYGSCAFILLDEDDRTSIDIDIAAPYSKVNFKELKKILHKIGLEINPSENVDCEHIEWISIIRLCLAKPREENKVILWSGSKLTVFTVEPEDLVASKLIRYDEIDQGDIRYIIFQMNIRYHQIEEAVQRLPAGFKNAPLVQENLKNLKQDIELWKLVK